MARRLPEGTRLQRRMVADGQQCGWLVYHSEDGQSERLIGWVCPRGEQQQRRWAQWTAHQPRVRPFDDGILLSVERSRAEAVWEVWTARHHPLRSTMRSPGGNL